MIIAATIAGFIFVALLAAASAGLQVHRKAIIPTLVSSLIALASWMSALAAATYLV